MPMHNNPLVVEVCFVMDCTGSMGCWIEAGKTYIRAIANNVQKEMKEKFDKNSVLRMAFVAYRDYSDRNRFDVIDFHNAPNLKPVEDKIASQKATGGGDLCEDVQGGLDKALKLSWTNNQTDTSSLRKQDVPSRAAQIIVWIGDCPGHTAFCHSHGTDWDSHLSGFPDVPLMKDIINRIKDQGIFLLLSDFTKQVKFMLNQIEKIYKDDNKENQIKRVPLNPQDTSSLLKEVQKQVNTIIASEFM